LGEQFEKGCYVNMREKVLARVCDQRKHDACLERIPDLLQNSNQEVADVFGFVHLLDEIHLERLRLMCAVRVIRQNL
jgi:hypothetical protein